MERYTIMVVRTSERPERSTRLTYSNGKLVRFRIMLNWNTCNVRGTRLQTRSTNGRKQLERGHRQLRGNTIPRRLPSGQITALTRSRIARGTTRIIRHQIDRKSVV